MKILRQLRTVITSQIKDLNYEQVPYIDHLINEAQEFICYASWCNFRIFTHNLVANQCAYNLFNCPTTNQDAVFIVEDVYWLDSTKYKKLTKSSLKEISAMYEDWWQGTVTGTPSYCSVDKDFLVIVPTVTATVTDGFLITTRAKANPLQYDNDVCKLHAQFQKYIVDYVLLKMANNIQGLNALEMLLNTKKQEALLRLDRFLTVDYKFLSS